MISTQLFVKRADSAKGEETIKRVKDGNRKRDKKNNVAASFLCKKGVDFSFSIIN